MVLRTLLFLALTLFVTPASAALFSPAIETLPNGLTVMVIENHRAPVVLHMIWYKVGSADEPAEHAGVAHFLEHMMFKGTRQHPDQDYSAEIAALGGEDNAFTSYDYTAFFARVHPRELENVMKMEAERITSLELDAEDIAVERGVVQQERAQRNESSAEARFGVEVNAMFYGSHPYARPVIGTRDTIDGYESRNIKPFYDEHYAPNNAVLIIVGDVNAPDVFKLAADVYGGLREADVPDRVRTGDILQTPERITRTAPEVQQPQLHLMWPAPSAHQNKKDSLAIQILVEALTSPDSKLQQDMMFRGKLAVGVDADYDSDRYNGSALSLSASPRAGVAVDTLERKLLATWRAALKNISESAVTRAKQRLLDTATLARDSIQTPAYVFGMALTTGQTVADVENWTKDIAAVSTADVRRVAHQFTAAPRLTAALLPEGAE